LIIFQENYYENVTLPKLVALIISVFHAFMFGQIVSGSEISQRVMWPFFVILSDPDFRQFSYYFEGAEHVHIYNLVSISPIKLLTK